MLKVRWTSAVSVCALSAFLIATTGCYGKFQLTRNLYQLNSGVKDEVARSIVTAVMVIFPVYWFGGLADWIVFNTIEFWTGKNPLTETVFEIKRADNGEIEAVQTSRRTPDGVETIVETYRHGQPAGTLTLRQATGSPNADAQMIWPDGTEEHYQIRVAGSGSPVVMRIDSSPDMRLTAFDR